MGQPVSVTIYGQQFTVVTAESPERVEAIAAKVDDLMRVIAARGIADSNRAAILSCLHFADRISSLEAEVAALEAELAKQKTKPAQKQKLNDLLSLLEDELK